MVLKEGGALDALRSLAKKKPTPANPGLSAQITDPAIAGAKRDKNTVRLGTDPSIQERAAYAAQLKAELDRAEADFAVLQAELRDYGASKRKLYNNTFKVTVTTVAVPYKVETPVGPEERAVQVICSNKYSVAKDIENHKESFGQHYHDLFTEERQKVLAPNAEELIRGILSDAGFSGEDLENAMRTLFEEKVKITAKENFETEIEKVPEPVKTVISQMVTRAQPGLKFA